jgi:hypothetical protein
MDFLNNSKVLAGISLILMNLGSKNIVADLGVVHNKILSHQIVKKIVIFAMFFVATRDVVIAFMLSVAYVVIFDGLLHEKRKTCIIPQRFIDNAYKQVITREDYLRALDVIKNYNPSL